MNNQLTEDEQRKVELWRQRKIRTRQALQGLGLAIENTRMFPQIQHSLKSMYHELNDYILTGYEEIASLGGDPYGD